MCLFVLVNADDHGWRHFNQHQIRIETGRGAPHSLYFVNNPHSFIRSASPQQGWKALSRDVDICGNEKYLLEPSLPLSPHL